MKGEQIGTNGQLLTQNLGNTTTVLEVGVFVGYSSLVWAHAVGPDGKVTGLEFKPEYAQKARETFERFGVKNVEIINGDAVETWVADLLLRP